MYVYLFAQIGLVKTDGYNRVPSRDENALARFVYQQPISVGIALATTDKEYIKQYNGVI